MLADIYFVVFPAWAGGNHLLNLISTSSEFDLSLSETELLIFYKNNKINTFHAIDTLFNIPYEDGWLHYIKNVNTERPKLIFGHMAHVMLLADENIQKKIHVILCDIPMGAGQKRMLLHNIASTNSYLWGEQIQLYKPSIISSILGISNNCVTNIGTDNLHNKDIIPILLQLEQELKITLPTEFCQQLHEIWYSEKDS